MKNMCRAPHEGLQVPYLPTVLLEDRQLGLLQPALPRLPIRLGNPCAQCGLLEHCRELYCQGKHSQSSPGQSAQGRKGWEIAKYSCQTPTGREL